MSGKKIARVEAELAALEKHAEVCQDDADAEARGEFTEHSMLWSAGRSFGVIEAIDSIRAAINGQRR